MMQEPEVRLLREGMQLNRDFARQHGFEDDARRSDAAINALSIVLGEAPDSNGLAIYFKERVEPEKVWGFLL